MKPKYFGSRAAALLMFLFLVIAKGQGVFQACVADSIPLSTNPDYPGASCAWCQLAEGQGGDKYCH